MADIDEDTSPLIQSVEVQESDEEEASEGEERIQEQSNLKTVLTPINNRRKTTSDFPFSVEERTASVSVNIPARPPRHHVTRPPPSKHHTRARWIVGVSITLVLLGLVAVAIALVVTATAPGETWYRKSVIYQCYPQSFQDSDGDGFGDLEGIRSRISYFKELGIRGVWLNPIYPSPKRDNGYDISDYTDIDPVYGNIEIFKRLLAELHENDIHLILDFVPNHTSDEHPWFKESKANKTNSKRDWYVWADGVAPGSPPNNWLSVFGNSSWTYDETTDQWYYHQFSSYQPDLNYSNPQVKQVMEGVLKFWLDLGVDGFRVDAVMFLLEDPQLQNETLNPLFNESECLTPPCYDSLVHNLTTNYPGIHEICQDWRKLVNKYSIQDRSEKILIGEIYDNIETVMTYYGNSSNEFTFPFNFFLLVNSDWSGVRINCIIKSWLDRMPGGATANWVLGNHDNSRIATKAGLFRARALLLLLLTLPGTPVTYYGDEILMTDVYVPLDKRNDTFQGRDSERTPMQWNTSNHSGFTFPKTEPWLPLATNYSLYNVEVEIDNSTSILSLYKKLLELHSTESAFYEGEYMCLNATEDLLVYLRWKESDASYKEYYIIVINFSDQDTSTKISLNFANTELVFSTYLDEPNLSLSSISLRKGEGLIIRGYLSDTCNKVDLSSSASRSCSVGHCL